MSRARARRLEVSPSAIGSVALHAAVAVLLMVQWGSRDLKVGGVVPVTIVSSAPDKDTRPAEQAAEVQTAQTEDTVAEAPPEVAPPPPPAPSSKTRPAEKTPAPIPAKPAAKPAEKSLDFDSLYASLGRPARNQPRPSSAQKGASRPETAPTPRTTTGSGLAQGAALQGLAEELQRRWNPNCEVEGGGEIIVRTTFQLGAVGQATDVVTRVSNVVIPRDPTVNCIGKTDRQCIVQVAADRAARAVLSAAPFRGLPADLYGQRITVNFNAREACAR